MDDLEVLKIVIETRLAELAASSPSPSEDFDNGRKGGLTDALADICTLQKRKASAPHSPAQDAL